MPIPCQPLACGRQDLLPPTSDRFANVSLINKKDKNPFPEDGGGWVGGGGADMRHALPKSGGYSGFKLGKEAGQIKKIYRWEKQAYWTFLTAHRRFFQL